MNNSIEKLETMNTKDENILMQNQITSDTKMLTSNNEQESQLECQTELTKNKLNIEHKNIPVDSLTSLKKHRNKRRITTPKVGRTIVLRTLASYTKARELQ
ncbi:6456_t:CDS:2 [Cetraspora pellucida]|uniref:6456_t:CDS:1 n=1 Tax=Cetraspora pellucida TaxID=1433469 RepID=A0A9N8VYZ6_9GLOM|nr:6456_t:CDS:2 [Cetraspora pellucida]